MKISLAILAASVVVAGAAGPIAPKSGAAMCALSPADFQSVGVNGTSKPSANVNDAGASVYCVYAGKSAATGGVELDVFYPAGASPADAKETFDTASGESGTKLQPITIAGADEARWAPDAVSGGPRFATMTVRRKSLVFSLGVPANAGAQAQLTKLAALLLQRF